jgi:hypothetical protein
LTTVVKPVLTRRAKQVYLACFFAHFLLVGTVCFRETFWLIAQGLTVLPGSANGPFHKATELAGAALGQALPASNPVRQSLAAYLNLAGIETGYGFFAPNVPAGYALVFELHYPDGQVEYELPRVRSAAARLRLSGLLDLIGSRRYEPLRELMLKMLAHAVWREHPRAVMIRAIFGSINPPNVAEFEAGKNASYAFLYSYDFSLRDETPQSSKP